MANNNNNHPLLENTILELRRGLIVLAVLNQLDVEQYGYSLIKRLSEKGLEVDQGTLYPLLRRLEAQGLLESSWRVENDHPRRYYAISMDGRKVLPQLKQEWENLVNIMNGILQ